MIGNTVLFHAHLLNSEFDDKQLALCTLWCGEQYICFNKQNIFTRDEALLEFAEEICHQNKERKCLKITAHGYF